MYCTGGGRGRSWGQRKDWRGRGKQPNRKVAQIEAVLLRTRIPSGKLRTKNEENKANKRGNVKERWLFLAMRAKTIVRVYR